MRLSMNKTESMVIAEEPVKCKLDVNDKPICQCMQCTYLGVEITSCKNLQQEVRVQINKALRIEDISAKSNVHIYKTAVKPALTDEAETRAYAKKRRT
ncbi:hypothetical protein Trydic_g23784 [Trypoxylus dichotomus]